MHFINALFNILFNIKSLFIKLISNYAKISKIMHEIISLLIHHFLSRYHYSISNCICLYISEREAVTSYI